MTYVIESVGYPSFSGGKLSGAELWDLFTGLEANDLADYTHVLTGYMGELWSWRVYVTHTV